MQQPLDSLHRSDLVEVSVIPRQSPAKESNPVPYVYEPMVSGKVKLQGG